MAAIAPDTLTLTTPRTTTRERSTPALTPVPAPLVPLVPFGARRLQPAYVVRIDPGEFSYDPGRQVNVMADGRLWADTPMAASSTATNNDTTPGNPPDEQADPYAFPGDGDGDGGAHGDPVLITPGDLVTVTDLATQLAPGPATAAARETGTAANAHSHKER